MTSINCTKRAEQFEAYQMTATDGGVVGNGPEIVAWINSGPGDVFGIYYDKLEMIEEPEGNVIQEPRPEHVRVAGAVDLVLRAGQYIVRGEDTPIAVYTAAEFADRFQV